MQRPSTGIGDHAERLAASGQVPQGILLLTTQTAAGNANAAFKLAEWRIRGDRLPRDLAAARELMRRAAEAGHPSAQLIFTNFLACGTGGPREWQKAVQRLKTLGASSVLARRQLEVVRAMALDEEGNPLSVPEAEVLSEAPHVLLFGNAFTRLECSYLAEAAGPLLQPAKVVDERTGVHIKNPIRTSDGAPFTWPLENPAVHAINRRIAALSGTAVEQGEPLQVLRYRPGQEYRPHLDAIGTFENQRELTLLVYLNDGYQGGETSFVKTGLTVKARQGDALLFRNVTPDGRADDKTLHAGLPVKSGVKLIASRWIRRHPFIAPPGRAG